MKRRWGRMDWKGSRADIKNGRWSIYALSFCSKVVALYKIGGMSSKCTIESAPNTFA